MKKQKNILYNNKGISLASVLVTVILMIIILTSIMYSNSRTNEIKEAMLINSDIEELTKKVEMYYLEKGTVPLYEDDSSNYNYKITQNGKNVIYYRLKISLLDNLNLNNYENISDKNEIIRQNGDQWYVINKQTHTIYFVKVIDDEIKLQTAAYSNKYADIMHNAETNGVFDTTGTSSNVNDTIALRPVTDSTSDVSGGLAVEENGNENGDNIVLEETAGSGSANYTYANYIGWNDTGTTATNLVLQYDGEYNAGKTGTYHNDSATTWKDLTGNGNDGSIVTHSDKDYYYYTDITNASLKLLGGYNYTLKETGEVDNRSTTKGSWTSKGLTLSSNKYVVKKTPSNLPSGNSNYTMEITFYYAGGNKKGLIGYGLYNNADSTMSNIGNYVTNIYNENKFEIFYNAFGIKYSYYPYTSTYSSSSLSVATSNNGKANALKINDSGNGITSYYYNNNTDTGNINLKNGIHTITVEYNGNTRIFVDGVLKATSEKEPSTSNIREITVGATNLKLSVYWTDSKNGSTKTGAGMAICKFNYQEFLNNTIYSVRIYNRALSDSEIQYNYLTDMYRFGSGT